VGRESQSRRDRQGDSPTPSCPKLTSGTQENQRPQGERTEDIPPEGNRQGRSGRRSNQRSRRRYANDGYGEDEDVCATGSGDGRCGRSTGPAGRPHSAIMWHASGVVEQVPQGLIAEAMSKSAISWLQYGELDRPRPAWHVWHEGAAYVVSDGAEQPLPGLDVADEVLVTIRSKDNGARLLTWVARAENLRHGSAEWHLAANTLSAARLNGRSEDRTLFWAADSTITRLTPTDRVLEHLGARPTTDHAAPPPATPATTRGPLPHVVHRRPTRPPAL
jgi:hypothetical protein